MFSFPSLLGAFGVVVWTVYTALVMSKEGILAHSEPVRVTDLRTGHVGDWELVPMKRLPRDPFFWSFVVPVFTLGVGVSYFAGWGLGVALFPVLF